METSIPTKNNRTQTIIIVVLVILVVGLLARYVFFKDQVDERGAGLDRIDQREEQYKVDNPNATDDEVETAFEQGIDGMEQRKNTYMANNPGATEEEAEAAMDAAFKSME